jgi:hypothetical protein
MTVFSVRMYPFNPTRNELELTADTALDALAKALTHFRNEHWRARGTFFEVRDHSGVIVLRADLS